MSPNEKSRKVQEEWQRLIWESQVESKGLVEESKGLIEESQRLREKYLSHKSQKK